MRFGRLDFLRLGVAARGVAETGTSGSAGGSPASDPTDADQPALSEAEGPALPAESRPAAAEQAPGVSRPTMMSGELASTPPPDRWDDWVEYEARAWPRKVERRYMLVPTTCFNCEAGCGLLAYVDKETMQVRKFEGNPIHPGSRGRNCAKGPATLNQTYDPERLLYPLKRVGPRGGGQWERTTWDEALDTLAATIRTAIV